MGFLERIPVTYRHWLIVFVLFLITTGLAAGELSYAPLGPFLADAFNLNKIQFGSLASAVFLGGAIITLPAGWVVDRMGVRIAVLFSSIGVLAALVGVSLADSYLLTVIMLMVLGLGYGFLMPATNSAVMSWIPAEYRAFSMGLKQSGTPIGTALAASILPPVAVVSGYQAAFLLQALIGLGTVLLFFLFYRDITRSATANYNEKSVVPASKLTPGKLVGSIRKCFVIGFTFATVQMAWITFLVPYLQSVTGIDVVAAAGYLAISQLAGALGRPILGMVSDRLLSGQRRLTLVYSAFLAGASMALLSLIKDTIPAFWVMTILMVLLGSTTMGWIGPYFTWVSEIAGAGSVGMGTAIAITINLVGITIGPILFGALAEAFSYGIALKVCAAWLIAVATVYLFWRADKPARPSGEYLPAD